MAEVIPQSTVKRVPFQAYLASDHITPATGKTIAVTISKNGAAYGNPSGGATNATAIGNGSYYVDLTTTDTGTNGPLLVRGAEGTIDDVIAFYAVGMVPADVLAVAGVPQTNYDGIAQAGASTTITLDSGDAQAGGDVTGRVITLVGATGVGQSRVITAYNTGTRVATVSPAWTVNPASGSQYVLSDTADARNVIGTATATVGGYSSGQDPATLVLDAVASAHNTALSIGSKINAPVVTVSAYASGQDPATLVLDVLASSHNTALSIGHAINTGGAAADPLLNAVPGSYAAGTAGYALGTRTGYKLASDGLDSVVVETGVNARQALSLIGAATAGKGSGLETATATYYAMGLSGTATARIVASTDANGNRTATTLSPPA